MGRRRKGGAAVNPTLPQRMRAAGAKRARALGPSTNEHLSPFGSDQCIQEENQQKSGAWPHRRNSPIKDTESDGPPVVGQARRTALRGRGQRVPDACTLPSFLGSGVVFSQSFLPLCTFPSVPVCCSSPVCLCVVSVMFVLFVSLSEFAAP